jgi:MtN3 and saliva related transmembrane protein
MVAGVLTTVAFVPQVLKTWKSRSGRDISLGTFALFSLGVLLWLLYGVAIRSVPIVVANAVTLLLALAVVVLKLYFDRAAAQAARPAPE